jgi:hypothetical protein
VPGTVTSISPTITAQNCLIHEVTITFSDPSFMVLFIVEEQESSPEETEISRGDEFRPDVG